MEQRKTNFFGEQNRVVEFNNFIHKRIDLFEYKKGGWSYIKGLFLFFLTPIVIFICIKWLEKDFAIVIATLLGFALCFIFIPQYRYNKKYKEIIEDLVAKDLISIKIISDKS